MLMRPIPTRKDSKIILLSDILTDISKAEYYAECHRNNIKRWHDCGHDWGIISGFDLAFADNQAYIYEQCAIRLKARFNKVLETLKY